MTISTLRAHTLDTLHVCICGTNDFVLRMASTLRKSSLKQQDVQLIIHECSLGEARSTLLTERPDIFIVDIGPTTSLRDTTWLHSLLLQARERLGSNIYIILAITSPSRFVAGGDMLFQDRSSLAPSGLINNILITPPAHIPSVMTLEQQLVNCIEYVTESLTRSDIPLPALWDDGWVPVMCDPESRNVWMRWLPRYAKYVNENPIIVGPTGSGKTRLAKAIHILSGRTGPFVTITPRDFSSTELMQAELFGAAAGAYTGAIDKWGLVKKADQGTLFVDELQSIDIELQGKLITFIENKRYRRVGEAEDHHADVRFVFATNRSLSSLVRNNSLRDDFAYRLERLQINLGSLNERKLDIGAGICFALAKVIRERVAAYASHSQKLTPDRRIEGLTPDAYQLLFASLWPGNFRQLENTIAKLVEIADIHNHVLIDHKCATIGMHEMLGKSETTAIDIFTKAASDTSKQIISQNKTSLKDAISILSHNVRCKALEATGGNISSAANLIGDSQKQLELFTAIREDNSKT